MMTDEELKQAILQYARKYYERNKEAPSLRKILKHFRKEKLNFMRFYMIFPKGISEVCRRVHISISADRIKRTERATKAAKERKKLNTVPSNQDLHIPFSHVFYVDEDGEKHSLDEWSNDICGDLLDLDSNIKGMMKHLAATVKKVEDLESNFEHKVFESLNITCPHCGGQMFFNVVCLNCKKAVLMQPPVESM
jgi:hypothetical protein